MKYTTFNTKMEYILWYIKDNSIDLIIIDPPYGINFKNNIYNDKQQYVINQIDNWLEILSRKLKPECHCYIFVPTLIIDIWIASVRKYFTFNNIVTVDVYFNSQQNPKRNDNFTFSSQHVIYCSKGKAREFNEVKIWKYSQDWIRDKRRSKEIGEYRYTMYPNFFDHSIARANEKRNQYKKNIHPNQKNVDFISKLILLSSNPEEIVLDSFMGSGTTILAAILNNRYSIGIEANPEIHEKAVNRIESCILKKDGYKKHYKNLLEI